MPATALTVYGSPQFAGTETAFAAYDNVNGNSFTNTGAELIYVKNTSGGPDTFTVDFPGTCEFEGSGATHDFSVTVAAGKTEVIGPFPKTRWNDGNGKVQIPAGLGANWDIMVMKK